MKKRQILLKLVSTTLTFFILLFSLSVRTLATETQTASSALTVSNSEVTQIETNRVLSEEGNNLNIKVIDNFDDTYTLTLYDYPVKYVDDDGLIKDISLDITKADDGSYVSQSSKIVTKFPAKISDGITLSDDEVSVNLKPAVQQSTNDNLTATTDVTAIKKSSKTMSYAYDSKTDLEYSLTYTGFKEDIVVKEYTGQTEYNFFLTTNGLILTEIDGSYFLTDTEGEIKVNIGDIIIFTADERNNTFGTMTDTTVKANQLYLMTIHLDPEWLADENTAYPIRIDPTLEINYTNNGANAIQDVVINSEGGSSATSGSLYIGKREDTGIARTLVKFPGLDVASYNSENLVSATLMLRDLMCQSEQMSIYAHIFTGNEWEQSTVNWSNVNPNSISYWTDIANVSYSNGTQASPVHWYGLDFSTAVYYWNTGAYSKDQGILLKADASVEYGTEYQHKTFASYNRSSYKPYVVITYIAQEVPGANGELWSFNEDGVSGWAWRSDIPNTAITVYAELCNSSGNIVETYTSLAGSYNSDLGGNGYHAFNIAIDWTELENISYSINVYAIGYNGVKYLLDGCPKTFSNIYGRYVSLNSNYRGLEYYYFKAPANGMYVVQSFGTQAVHGILYWGKGTGDTIPAILSTKEVIEDADDTRIINNYSISFYAYSGQIVTISTKKDIDNAPCTTSEIQVRRQIANFYTFDYPLVGDETSSLDTTLDPSSPILTTLQDMDYNLNYYENMSSNHVTDNNYERLNCDLFIFWGHGNYNAVKFYNSLLESYEFNQNNRVMEHTQLAMWNACDTGVDDGFAEASVTGGGAKTSIGWKEIIYQPDNEIYLRIFLQQLQRGLSVQAAVDETKAIMTDVDGEYKYSENHEIFNNEVYGDKNNVIFNAL